MTDVDSPAAVLLRYARFPLQPGLTAAELDTVEREFGFSFADDHRTLLAEVLPTGRGWPDWRDGDRDQLREKLALPVDGVLFDIAENGFWYEGWGPRPAADAQALAVARGFLLTTPRLIPVYSHRYLPAGRGAPPHPVLSVMQTDVIPYGPNLTEYLKHEFAGLPLNPTATRPTVPFWKDLAG